MRTEIARRRDAAKPYDPPTPLQQRLDQLGKWLGWATLIICAIVFAVGVLRLVNANPIADLGDWLAVTEHQEALIELFMVAVSLAIAAVPEGLPAVVTIALALGMQRMIGRHVLIRKLAAVETLGSANIICLRQDRHADPNEMTSSGDRRRSGDRRDGRGVPPEGAFRRPGRNPRRRQSALLADAWPRRAALQTTRSFRKTSTRGV
jgi:Ca2+-transporting ATPase